MSTDTDLRLRSELDANQRDREQMWLAVLALDQRYSEVRPRHTHGGRDGGRDIEATLDGDRTAYGAVGFANGANDSNEQKKVIRKKFRNDLATALKSKSDLKAFVFFTNLHLTMGEQDAMKAEAKKFGIEHCDVLDRERLRVELDSQAGFFIRFQYLRIPLSAEEQASFLSRYGDRLQDVVSTGFSRVEKTLNRVLFLQESADVLDSIHVRIRLKEEYSADEIGHFRAYWLLALRAVTHGIFQILSASTDKSKRFSEDGNAQSTQQPTGICHGIASGQWENHISLPFPDHLDDASKSEAEGAEEEQDDEKWTNAGGGSGAGSDPVSQVVVSYTHDDPLIRFRPRLQLRALDDAMFMPILSLSLAEKVSSFDVFANGYHLLAIGEGDFLLDRSAHDFTLPGDYTPEELADTWVRIRPASGSSAFHLRFASRTPRRMFGYEDVPEQRSQLAGPPGVAPASEEHALEAQ